ncbi:MAG: hypothetical protein AABZ57_08140 [Candidatus Margulisiibacteriota bacterium]
MNLERELDNLLRQGKLKKQKSGLEHVEALLFSAKNNYEAAVMLSGKIDEAAFKLAYDVLLQIGRSVLLINGYKPDDGQQHKTTFLVAGYLLGPELTDLVNRIQKFRIKRNDCVYEPKGLVTKAEMAAIFSAIKEFWAKTKKYLEKKDKQLRLFDKL